MEFKFERTLPVRAPYRLDFTVDALRRLAANIVDIVDQDGCYRRALQDRRGTNVIEVRQRDARTLVLRIAGPRAARWVGTVEAMLGTQRDLQSWFRNARAFPWLAKLATRFRGVHPPRYPTLWEAMAHAIVFQQISIASASAIMRRAVAQLSPPVESGGIAYYPFFTPSQLLYSADEPLRAAGLSANKIQHLRSAALAIEDRSITEAMLAKLPSAAAAERLRSVRGIGPWSAAVVLLRGCGRLDVFPLKDSGVAHSLRLVSGDAQIDADALLRALGPMKGMLYFHLLLGRMRGPAE